MFALLQNDSFKYRHERVKQGERDERGNASCRGMDDEGLTRKVRYLIQIAPENHFEMTYSISDPMTITRARAAALSVQNPPKKTRHQAYTSRPPSYYQVPIALAHMGLPGELPWRMNVSRPEGDISCINPERRPRLLRNDTHQKFPRSSSSLLAPSPFWAPTHLQRT
jgi:hypothetical protein